MGSNSRSSMNWSAGPLVRWSAGPLVRWSVVALALGSTVAAQTRKAVESLSKSCPDTSHTVGSATYFHNSFEADSSLIASSQKWTAFQGSGVYPPNGTWAWSFGSNGIAGENSDYGAENGPAPDGDFVAFLQWDGSTTPFFEYQAALPGGTSAIGKTWRISFMAAQRILGGEVSEQIVQVTGLPTQASPNSPQILFEEQLRDGIYRKYVSIPFVATTPSVLIRFSGTKAGVMPFSQVGHTALIDRVEFREVMPWALNATWMDNAAPPGPNDDVLIPEEACVAIGAGLTATANTVTVEGELLALDGTVSGSLSTRSLLVHHHRLSGGGLSSAPTGTSLFQVGNAGARYQVPFSLVLDDDTNSSAEENNVLKASDNGWIEMHGRTCTSWLHLAENAGPSSVLGASVIQVESVPVGWTSGDVIAIAPSDRDGLVASPWSSNPIERATISSITPVPGSNPPLGQITLTSALQQDHCGHKFFLSPPLAEQPHSIDQRAEVGLLSHNVRVLGQSRTTPPPDKLGGHVMIAAEEPALVHPGFGRFSCIELFNMGRAGQLGRYSMHWHLLLGSGKGVYMKSSSIHSSNSRVVAVHGTDYTLFEDNVAVDHLGHGVFLEDGSEQFNVFRNNLIMGTRPPSPGNELLPSDIAPRLPGGFQSHAPAAFWITNPNNVFDGNVVAGADGTGFWFALPDRWMGKSGDPLFGALAYFSARTPNVNEQRPFHQVLGQFTDNVCHSAFMAIDMNDSIQAITAANAPPIGTIVANVEWTPFTGAVQSLLRLTAYSCNVGIYTGSGMRNFAFDQTALADNSWQTVMASHDIVRNTVIVHDSGQNLWPSYPPGSYLFGNPRRSIAIVLYDGAAEYDNVHCQGFDAPVLNHPLPYNPSTVLWDTGGSSHHTGWPMTGMNVVWADGSPMTQPVLDFDDVSQDPPAGFNNYSGLDPRDPRQWAFSVQNIDRSLFPNVAAANPPLTTVVANHRLMTGTGQDAWLNSTHTACALPFRFDYLRVVRTDTPANSRAILSAGNLRFERQNTVSNQSVVYDDPWIVNPYKQMAMLVDRLGETNHFRYTLDWFDASTSTPLTIPVNTQLLLGEMATGDSCVVGLRRYAGNHPVTNNPPTVLRALALAPLTLTSVTQVNSMVLLDSSSQTCWYPEPSTGILWIKVFAGAPGSGTPAIPVELLGIGDGPGQALLIDY